MRGIAALSVLVYHVWLYAAPDGGSAFGGPVGQIAANLRAGVTLFFALSGFLLYRAWADATAGGRPPSVRRYFRNRLLRIAPAYLAILILVAALFERALWDHPWQLAANLALAQNYVPAYIYGLGIVPAWSLCIEVSFYAVLPLLGWLALRRGNAWLPVILMAAVGLLAKAIPVGGPVWGLTILTHADWFAAGMATAVLYRRNLPTWWRLAAAAGTLALVVAGVLLYDRGILSALANQSLIAPACGLILLLVVRDAPPLLTAILHSSPLTRVGLISYSVFLWHDPLLRWLRAEGLTHSGPTGFILNLALVATLTILLSIATYLLVEKPALTRKGGHRAVPIAEALAAP
jgi:peptidoglycan/LPS O-acetylase OafA/YrhL